MCLTLFSNGKFRTTVIQNSPSINLLHLPTPSYLNRTFGSKSDEKLPVVKTLYNGRYGWLGESPGM